MVQLKPASTNKKIPHNQGTQPLIPAHIIDVSSQKTYFIAIFLLIQAWKIQQCFILKGTLLSDASDSVGFDQFAFILKFFIIDSLYLWILPVFRIPLLTFHPFITFLQSIVVTSFTLLLSCNLSMLFSTFLATFFSFFTQSKNVPTIFNRSTSSYSKQHIAGVEYLGSHHKRKSNILNEEDEHFIGKKTINILPKSTSYFNPFHDTFCIDPAQSIPTIASKVSIPVKFNSSNDISSIEVVYTDYDNQTTVTKYQKKQLKSLKVTDKHKFNSYLRKDLIINGNQVLNGDLEYTVTLLDKSRISFVEIPIERPGLYKVGKVLDDKNLPVKVYRTNIIISKCPSANIFEYTQSTTESQSALHGISDTFDKSYKCLGDISNLNLKISGVPPLRVKYKKYVNEKVETVEEKLLQPNSNFKSPLAIAASVMDSNTKSTQLPYSVSDFLRKLDAKDLRNFFVWSNEYEIELNMSNIVKEVGDYSFKLEEVEDGFGNIVNFSRIYANEYNYKHESRYASLEDYLKSEALFQTFKAYESPRLKLMDSVPNKPLIENESRELRLIINGLDRNSAQNYNELKKYEPIFGNITYVSNNDNVLDANGDSVNSQRNVKLIKNYEFNSANDFKFIAQNSGAYNLESVDLKYCPGLIDDSNRRIDIFKAFKPYLSVLSSSSINDTCLGQIGLSFDLLLTGIPPFEVKVHNYQFTENGHKKLIDTKRLKIPSSNRFQYNYEPKHEGKYEIEFNSIHDSIYKNFLDLTPIDKYRFKTSMRGKPDASFLEIFNQQQHSGHHIHHHNRAPVEKKLCLSTESEILPVKLSGEAPFEVSYDIVEKVTSRIRSYKSKPIEGNLYNLRLPVFTKGGNYKVSLTSVKDKSGCVALLESQDININIKKELPSAELEPTLESKVIKTKEGKGYQISVKEGEFVDLPVKLVGEKNIQLTYQVLNDQNEVISNNLQKTFNNHQNKPVFRSSIRVSNSGVYYLTGVKDGLCLGNVNDKVFYNVTYHPKPDLVINESINSKVTKSNLSKSLFVKEDICLNEDHNIIDLVLKGKGPFVIDYVIELPNGVRKPKSIKVSSNFISINILSDLHKNEKMKGTYKFVFKSISDSIYSKSDLKALTNFHFEEKVVTQKVLQIPNARFNYKHNNKVLQTCSHNLITSHNNLNEKNSKFEYGENKFLDSLVMSLEGYAPFTVHLEVYNENFNKFHTIILEELQGSKVHLNKEIVQYLSLGNHFITIKKVIDGKGCIKDDFPQQSKELNSISSKNANVLLDNQIMISITDVPKISKVTSASDYCIGEYVNYKLHGSGPFEVKYLFNGHKKSAKVKDLVEFKRLLVEPGVLEIVSISDSFNCHVEVSEQQKKDLSINIHDKPSVEILNADDENIQEGDEVEIVFKFKGTAPFSMIYRRIFNNLKDFEIYHVNNIEENEYRIKTSLQGSYDAIELKDAHCEVRRNV